MGFTGNKPLILLEWSSKNCIFCFSLEKLYVGGGIVDGWCIDDGKSAFDKCSEKRTGIVITGVEGGKHCFRSQRPRACAGVEIKNKTYWDRQTQLRRQRRQKQAGGLSDSVVHQQAPLWVFLQDTEFERDETQPLFKATCKIFDCCYEYRDGLYL